MRLPLSVADSQSYERAPAIAAALKFVAIAVLGCALANICRSSARANPTVRLDFNLTLQDRSRNAVFIELYDDRPLTRDNFLQYVNGGLFDGMLMHRLARNFVLQGGGYYPVLLPEPQPLVSSLDPTARVDLDGNPNTNNPTVNNEFNNTPMRSNVRGTLAMAKQPGNPNSATSEFFFNIVNNGGTSPNGLDFQNGGFTAFAQVVGDGMALIDAFNSLTISNLNPDYNDDGTRDAGWPFFNNSSDGTPTLGNNLLIMSNADRIDYLGLGLSTDTTGGLIFSTRDAFIDTGTIFTGSGGLGIGAGRKLGIREGYSLGRSLTNHGTLEPGLQLGSITVPSYSQFADGTLNIQLRGTTVDTEYDRLAVTNNASLAGKLNVSLISGFAPTQNNSFTVLTAASITSSFSTITLPQLTSGLVWSVSKTATAISLTVNGGDYNHNGVVDGGDYIVWRNTLNQTGASLAADGTGPSGTPDGVVNNLDYLLWRNNFGNKAGGILGAGAGAGAGDLAAASLPEPSSAFLIACGGLMLAGYRGRWAAFRRRNTA